MHDDSNTHHISKSELKRQMHELQALGEELTKLTPAQLEKIVIPNELRDAILHANHITSRGAHKRQLQYIGRLMRDIDPAPIKTQLDQLRQKDAAAKRHFHQIEQWRDRLISEGDSALDELLANHHDIDRQQFRALIRKANKERSQNNTPQAARKLFHLLQEVLDTDSDY